MPRNKNKRFLNKRVAQEAVRLAAVDAKNENPRNSFPAVFLTFMEAPELLSNLPKSKTPLPVFDSLNMDNLQSGVRVSRDADQKEIRDKAREVNTAIIKLHDAISEYKDVNQPENDAKFVEGRRQQILVELRNVLEIGKTKKEKIDLNGPLRNTDWVPQLMAVYDKFNEVRNNFESAVLAVNFKRMDDPKRTKAEQEQVEQREEAKMDSLDADLFGFDAKAVKIQDRSNRARNDTPPPAKPAETKASEPAAPAQPTAKPAPAKIDYRSIFKAGEEEMLKRVGNRANTNAPATPAAEKTQPAATRRSTQETSFESDPNRGVPLKPANATPPASGGPSRIDVGAAKTPAEPAAPAPNTFTATPANQPTPATAAAPAARRGVKLTPLPEDAKPAANQPGNQFVKQRQQELANEQLASQTAARQAQAAARTAAAEAAAAREAALAESQRLAAALADAERVAKEMQAAERAAAASAEAANAAAERADRTSAAQAADRAVTEEQKSPLNKDSLSADAKQAKANTINAIPAGGTQNTSVRGRVEQIEAGLRAEREAAAAAEAQRVAAAQAAADRAASAAIREQKANVFAQLRQRTAQRSAEQTTNKDIASDLEKLSKAGVATSKIAEFEKKIEEERARNQPAEQKLGTPSPEPVNPGTTAGTTSTTAVVNAGEELEELEDDVTDDIDLTEKLDLDSDSDEENLEEELEDIDFTAPLDLDSDDEDDDELDLTQPLDLDSDSDEEPDPDIDPDLDTTPVPPVPLAPTAARRPPPPLPAGTGPKPPEPPTPTAVKRRPPPLPGTTPNPPEPPAPTAVKRRPPPLPGTTPNPPAPPAPTAVKRRPPPLPPGTTTTTPNTTTTTQNTTTATSTMGPSTTPANTATATQAPPLPPRPVKPPEPPRLLENWTKDLAKDVIKLARAANDSTALSRTQSQLEYLRLKVIEFNNANFENLAERDKLKQQWQQLMAPLAQKIAENTSRLIVSRDNMPNCINFLKKQSLTQLQVREADGLLTKSTNNIATYEKMWEQLESIKQSVNATSQADYSDRVRFTASKIIQFSVDPQQLNSAQTSADIQKHLQEMNQSIGSNAQVGNGKLAMSTFTKEEAKVNVSNEMAIMAIKGYDSSGINGGGLAKIESALDLNTVFSAGPINNRGDVGISIFQFREDLSAPHILAKVVMEGSNKLHNLAQYFPLTDPGNPAQCKKELIQLFQQNLPNKPNYSDIKALVSQLPPGPQPLNSWFSPNVSQVATVLHDTMSKTLNATKVDSMLLAQDMVEKMRATAGGKALIIEPTCPPELAQSIRVYCEAKMKETKDPEVKRQYDYFDPKDIKGHLRREALKQFSINPFTIYEQITENRKISAAVGQLKSQDTLKTPKLKDVTFKDTTKLDNIYLKSDRDNKKINQLQRSLDSIEGKVDNLSRPDIKTEIDKQVALGPPSKRR
jgi:hypothetical protein